MTTNLDIIKRAMKKLHVLSSGIEPTAAQAADGMSLLQSLIVELIGHGTFGRLNDVLASADYTAREFDRIQYETGTTITLPTSIIDINFNDYGFVEHDYWQFFSASPRPPMDRAIVVKIDSLTSIAIYYIWCAYKAAWIAVNDLAQQDAFPFADYLENGFASLLAEAWANEWDQEIGAATKSQANACRMMLSTRRDSQPRNTSEHSQYM